MPTKAELEKELEELKAERPAPRVLSVEDVLSALEVLESRSSARSSSLWQSARDYIVQAVETSKRDRLHEGGRDGDEFLARDDKNRVE